MYIRFRKLTVDGWCIHIHQSFIRLHGILKSIRINRIARSGSKATASEAKTPFSVRFFTPFYIRLTCIGNKTTCFRSSFGNRFRLTFLIRNYTRLGRHSIRFIKYFGRHRICFRFNRIDYLGCGLHRSIRSGNTVHFFIRIRSVFLLLYRFAISQLNRLCNGFQLFLFQLVIQHFGFLSGLLYQRRLQCFLRIEIERTGCNQKDNSCGSSHILPFSS